MRRLSVPVFLCVALILGNVLLHPSGAPSLAADPLPMTRLLRRHLQNHFPVETSQALDHHRGGKSRSAVHGTAPILFERLDFADRLERRRADR